jgi:membrane protein required for colicin V production
MQTYDIIMLAVLAGSTLFGFVKGMAWQLASLASFFLSYVVALKFSPMLAPHVGQQEPLNRFAAMLILYLGTSLAIWLIFRVVAGVIDRVKLKEFDRQVGGLFGAAKGVLLCIVVTFFAVSLSEEVREHILFSRSGHYIAVLLDKADPVLPEGLHEVLDPYLHKLDEQLDPRSARRVDDDSWQPLEEAVEDAAEDAIRERFNFDSGRFK